MSQNQIWISSAFSSYFSSCFLANWIGTLYPGTYDNFASPQQCHGIRQMAQYALYLTGRRRSTRAAPPCPAPTTTSPRPGTASPTTTAWWQITLTRASGNPGNHLNTDIWQPWHRCKIFYDKIHFKIHIFFSSSLLESTRIEYLACADVYPAASLGKLDFGRTTSLQLGSSIAIECYNDTRLRARYSLFPC